MITPPAYYSFEHCETFDDFVQWIRNVTPQEEKDMATALMNFRCGTPTEREMIKYGKLCELLDKVAPAPSEKIKELTKNLELVMEEEAAGKRARPTPENITTLREYEAMMAKPGINSPLGPDEAGSSSVVPLRSVSPQPASESDSDSFEAGFIESSDECSLSSMDLTSPSWNQPKN